MRQQKMGRQVQKELSEIFMKHARDYFPKSMVTITQVKLTPDLGIAKVYLSVFPNENVDQLFETLDSKHGDIKKQLGNQMGKRTRRIPSITFFHDEVNEHASRMDKLIDDLNIPLTPDQK